MKSDTPAGKERDDSGTGGRKAFAGNVSWMVVGNLGFAICNWGILVVLARVGSADIVGRFAIGLAVVSPIVLFCSLQLRQIQATDTTGRYRFADYVATRGVSMAVGLVAVYVACLIGGFERSLILITMMLAIWKTFEFASDVFFGKFQQNDRLDLIGKSKILRGLLSLVLVAVVLAVTKSLLLAMSALAIGNLVILLIYDLPHLKPFLAADRESFKDRSWNWRVIGEIALAALPLGLMATVFSLEVNVPRYILHSSAGERALGIFASFAYTTRAIQTIVAAVNQTSLTPLARAFNEGRSADFRRILVRLICLGAGLGCAGIIGAWLLGEFLLTLIFGPDFGAENDVFVTMLIGFAVYITAEPILIAARAMHRNWLPFVVRLLTLVVITIASLKLIPERGLEGAALVVVIGAVFGAVLQFVMFIFLSKQAPNQPE